MSAEEWDRRIETAVEELNSSIAQAHAAGLVIQGTITNRQVEGGTPFPDFKVVVLEKVLEENHFRGRE